MRRHVRDRVAEPADRARVGALGRVDDDPEDRRRRRPVRAHVVARVRRLPQRRGILGTACRQRSRCPGDQDGAASPVSARTAAAARKTPLPGTTTCCRSSRCGRQARLTAPLQVQERLRAPRSGRPQRSDRRFSGQRSWAAPRCWAPRRRASWSCPGWRRRPLRAWRSRPRWRTGCRRREQLVGLQDRVTAVHEARVHGWSFIPSITSCMARLFPPVCSAVDVGLNPCLVTRFQ